MNGLRLVGVLVGCALPLTAWAAPKPDAVAHEAWRASLAEVPLPEGCFRASYPNRVWVQAQCMTAPARPYIPRSGHSGYTVGDGKDYAAATPGLISTSVGSFPSVTGVTMERGADNEANTYSIQLNSQFFTTTVCNGASDPAECQGWQQFVYSNSGVAFMQYWLIDYGSRCPSGGWMAYQGSCYRNSNGVSVPTQAIGQLAHLMVTGKAVKAGSDTLVFTTANDAYSVTGADTVVKLAYAWDASEYNIVGDGGGSAAKFNRGSSVGVKIALTDGSTAAPTCESNAGTTGETNNLTLGACSKTGGSTPYVSFTETH